LQAHILIHGNDAWLLHCDHR